MAHDPSQRRTESRRSRLQKSPIRPRFQLDRSRYSTNHRSDSDVYAADSNRVNRQTFESSGVNGFRPAPNHNSSTPAPKARETPAIDLPISESTADPSPSMHARSAQNPPPLSKPPLGRALRSLVFQNAKLREPALDADKVQNKIESVVTENVSEAFAMQMKKVKKEMDVSQPASHPEVMARAKDQLLNGLGNKGATRDNASNAWLKRRDDGQSLLASTSTSILPTPPPSEPLPVETMDKPAPKAPKAMLMPPALPSLKGKEKAVEAEENNNGSTSARRASFTRISLRASPMQNVSEHGSQRARSPLRRVSPSLSQSSFASHKRRVTGDELPSYRHRSPPPSRTNFAPPDRRRSPSRSTDYSHSPVRSGRRPSPPRPPSHLVHGEPPAHTRHRSSSRSPPPASYSNGFRPRSYYKSRSRSTERGRAFSGGADREFNTRHAYERKRKLRSPHSHSPYRQRRRSSSYDPDFPTRERFPASHANGKDFLYSTPSIRSSRRGYDDSPTQLFSSFGPPPSSSIRDSSLPPPPPNPCNNVPGLWFVKVGANSSTVLEGRFVVEPEFAATWGLLPTASASTARPAPKLSVVLLCLTTEAASALYESLIPTNPSAERMATAVAELETTWPQDGTLFLDMNEQAGGRTWLPHEISPASPLDVTDHIQPGPNVVRFIQLASMAERTFIMYASPRKPPDTTVSQMFENAVSTQIASPLFNFGATTAIITSQFL
ncbi:hypothetical protein MSAN_00361700 [Mycena sanguinolenta]|uniref:Uncharacterized protein n=1 Tax=Mycena sanguinolenta TaxID=230812 RepID=A0A8H6ZBV0_9AGAR|nr:hypothetical protein MSAN_00361700 [Mycena sanguinolenta]